MDAESLAELLGEDKEQQHWLVFEETGQTLSALYAQSANPDYEWLFLHTPYAGFLKRSPLVLRLDSAGREVRRAFMADPLHGAFRGVIVSSRHSQDAVLAHLRHCLEVRFYGNRQAMLRYYHPAIAACLFAPDSEPHRQWLGPLDQWVWFGTTNQHHDEQPRWYALRDKSDAHSAPPTEEMSQPITLSNGQENALERHIRTSRTQQTHRTSSEQPTTARQGNLT